VDLALDAVEDGRHLRRREARNTQALAPFVEHPIRRAEGDHPVDERAAADGRTLQNHDGEIVGRAHAAFRIEARRHVSLVLGQLIRAHETAFLDQQHVTTSLGEPSRGDATTRSAADHDDIGDRALRVVRGRHA
jgi:hypothetical protein